MMNANKRRARKALDRRFDGMPSMELFQTPPKGWVRAIRDAMGMTAEQLGHRMDIRQQSLAEIERSEARGTIQLRTLRWAAEALDCQLVYVLVPREPLQKRVERKAIEVARRLLWKQGCFDGPEGWAFCTLSGLSEWVLASRHRRLWSAQFENRFSRESAEVV